MLFYTYGLHCKFFSLSVFALYGIYIFQSGFTQRGTAGRGRGGRGITRGSASSRGVKRPGDGAGGPALKRDFNDFSADSSMAYF